MFYESLSDAASYVARLESQGYTNTYLRLAYGEGKYAGKVVGYWVGGTPPEKPKPDPEPDPDPPYTPPTYETIPGTVETRGLSGEKTESFYFYFTVPYKRGRFNSINYSVLIDGKTIVSKSRQSGEQKIYVDIDQLSDKETHTVRIKGSDSTFTSESKFDKSFSFTVNKNSAPFLYTSLESTQLGSRYENFSINYTVTDEDSSDVKVSILIDDTIVVKPESITLGIRKDYTVDVTKLSIGSHTIKVKAQDDGGLTNELIFNFTRVNSAPIISGKDEDLGARNTPFSYSYTVDDREGDNLTIVEKLNGNVLRNIKNATRNYTYTISIDKDQIQSIELSKKATIEIEASDDKGSTSYRRVTFTRDNIAPIISGSDIDLGKLDKEFTYTYQVSDLEGDPIEVEVFLDSKVLQARAKAEPSKDYEIKIDGFEFLKISYGTHRVRIIARDSVGNKSERLVTFERVAKRLVMQLAKSGIPTDELASKVLVATTGVSLAKLATLKVEVCNNSFDENPTWEDATNMTLAGKAFNFQNLAKTSEQAGLNIRFTVEKNEAKAFSYITAIGGSYE